MHKIYDPEFYKVVFFSSAPIGVAFLEKLHEDKRFDVTGVVTMPDAPAGRGMKMQENVIKTKGNQIQAASDKLQDTIPSSLRAEQSGAWQSRTNHKIILLHGKDTDPSKKRYPQFINAMQDNNIPIHAPILPHANDPVLAKRIQELEKGNPDENTILV